MPQLILESTDVGGGWQPKGQVTSDTANASLLWMVQQVEIAKLEIKWSPKAFAGVPAVEEYLKSIRGTRPSRPEVLSDQVLEKLRVDATQPIHDTVTNFWRFWWFLELFPSWSQFYDSDEKLCKELW